MKEKVTIGLIGAGALARKQHLPNIARSALFDLKTVCDCCPTAIEEARKRCDFRKSTTNYLDLLNDDELDAVIIATKEDMQANLTVQALEHGKHVYVEKPLATTPDQAEAVCEAQKKSGKIVAVGFNRRFAPAITAVKQSIQNGGGLFNLHYRVSDGGMLFAGSPGSRTEGSRVFYELCHFFDLFRFLTESEIKTVYCHASRADDEAYLLTTESGVTISLMSTSYAGQAMTKERMEGITKLGSFAMDEFCELQTFDIPGMAPIQYFAGHTTPGMEFSHKSFIKELGMTGMQALKRGEAMALHQLLSNLQHPEEFPVRILDREKLLSDLIDRKADHVEVMDFVRMNLLGYGAYKAEKGWAFALDNFARGVLGEHVQLNAGPWDGLRANQIAYAAVESRKSGKVVEVN